MWFLIACSAPSPADEPFRTTSFEAMGTRIDVTLPERAGAADAVDAVASTFREVEETSNEWRAGTPLAQVNAAAGGDPVPVPDEVRALVRRGVAIGDLTDGAFDVTWAAVWDLWDFHAADPRPPDRGVLAARVRLIDHTRVQIDDHAGTLRLPEAGMKLGLGAIAKGWALDRSAGALRERGFHDFLVSAGGQVYAGGTRGGRPWRVGVRDPDGGRDDVSRVLEATDLSVSTSGDYERFFVHEGVRYHHILDPDTGLPARGTRSATVVSPDATLADALSTAVFVLGPVEGIALAERLPDVDALVIDEAGAVHATSGLR